MPPSQLKRLKADLHSRRTSQNSKAKKGQSKPPTSKSSTFAPKKETSQQKAHRLRATTLLPELQRRNKVGTYTDRRIGEDDPTLTPAEKASEKEKIATFIRDNDLKGDTLKKLKFNGRPSRLDLVRRYCKKTGAHEEIANALPTKALEDQLTRVADRSAKEEGNSVSRLTPSPTSSDKRRRSSSVKPADATPAHLTE